MQLMGCLNEVRMIVGGGRRYGAIHIPTIFPATLLPNDRYPVIATRTYIPPAEPMLAPMTLEVLIKIVSKEHKNVTPNQILYIPN